VTAGLAAAGDDYVPAARAAAAPARDLDRTIAHLLMTAEINTGHLDRHVTAAQGAAGPASRAFNLLHARNHAAVVAEHQAKLRDALIRRVPAAGRELALLGRAGGGGARKAGPDLDRALAHDLAGAITAAGHVTRHLDEAAGSPASVAFNLEHAATHVREMAHYHHELAGNLAERLPAVTAETGRLRQLIALTGAPPPARRSAGPEPA